MTNFHTKLGRVVDHDPRSFDYAIAGKPLSSLKSVRWTRRIPILNQEDLITQGIHIKDADGNPINALASCTANAAVGWAGTDSSHRKGLTISHGEDLDELYAVEVYSDATKLDGISDNTWPIVDGGSSGLGAVKALKKRGLVKSYHHCFSLQATLTALTTSPVLLGVGWHESSFTAASDGRVPIAGDVVGGHEILLDELDTENRRAWFANSWSQRWAKAGRAWFSWDDLGILLDDRGDALVAS